MGFVDDAKARLDQGVGEPATQFVSVSDFKAAFDDLAAGWASDINAAKRVVYWPGSGGVGTWPGRPTLAVGEQIEWRSVLDADAPPPPGAVAGDSWKRAPGAGAA